MMQMPPVKTDFFTFEGGLDLVTPPLQIRPGFCRQAQNYEIGVNGGYRGIDGYERFDGRQAPSEANFWYLPLTITGAIVAGNAINGQTSGATGTVVYVDAGALVLRNVTGAFISGENIRIVTTVVGAATADSAINGAPSNSKLWQYKNHTADYYRGLITACPGSGPILGVGLYKNYIVAARNNAGGTAAELWMATLDHSVSGWVKMQSPAGPSPADARYEVPFSAIAMTDIDVGDTLTQGGVTAVIGAIVMRTTVSPFIGSFLISAPSGGSFAAGAATTTGVGACTLTSASDLVSSLLPNGSFEFCTYNFGSGEKLYFCDGVNPAHEWDGTYLIPIRTGTPGEAPDHIVGHKNQLALAFDSSVLLSGLGDPHDWSAVSGGEEIAIGETVTNFLEQVDGTSNSALGIYGKNATYVLYGTSGGFNLATVLPDTGARAKSAQYIGTAMVLDDRGVTSLQTSQNYGNFDGATISKLIKPWIMTNKTALVGSMVCRDKNQYRLFFSGGQAMYYTIGGGFMPQLFLHNFTCFVSGEDTEGNEVMFAGDDDGYVYQLDKGTSFDGETIDRLLVLVFNHTKSPRTLKRYRKLVLECAGEGYSEFSLSAGFSYDRGTVEPLPGMISPIELDSGTWDDGGYFDDGGVWDGQILAPSEHELGGTAENISLKFNQSSDSQSPLTFFGALIHYTPRRQLR